jgi:hypothetical protein
MLCMGVCVQRGWEREHRMGKLPLKREVEEDSLVMTIVQCSDLCSVEYTARSLSLSISLSVWLKQTLWRGGLHGWGNHDSREDF